MLKPRGRASTVSAESVEPLKRISCLRCQQRKIKCTRRYPCNNCTQASQECKFRDHDVKRRPVSSQYVLALENRIAWFESFVVALKSASNAERENMLRGVQFQDHMPKLPLTDNGNQAIEETSPLKKERTMSLQTNSYGSLLYHGPTSMYQEEIYAQGEVLARNQPSCTRDNKLRSRNYVPSLELEEGFVNEALSLFFTSQYPQFMFVYREAFLKDYFDHQSDGKYWSYPLLYAICVLGAAISPQQKMRDKCGEISTRAQSMIIVDELEDPHITTVQALLCLAFYEIGNGNHSKGWSLSGMAFRIGQELGFQQDPKLWTGEDETRDTKEDREIRRRIYWGCYVADKLISLYLGRPIFLHEEDANVNPTEPLPDFPETHTWFGLSDQIKSAARLKMVVTFRCMIDLSKTIQDLLSQVFSPKASGDPSIREGLRSSRLSFLNTSLSRWYSALPAELLLKPSPSSVQSHVAMVHVLYHSILISLNRHFIRPSPGFPSVLQSRGISEFSADSIITLLRQLRAQGNLRNSPIIFVYAAVMAGSAILLLKPKSSATIVEEPRLSFVLKVLDECSWTYKIAAEAKIRVQNSLFKYYGGASAQDAHVHATELGPSSLVLGTSSVQTHSTMLDSENWLPSGQTQDSTGVDLPSPVIDESSWFMDAWNSQSGIQDAMFTDVSGDLFGGIWMPLDN